MDATLVRLSDPAALRDLVFPAGDDQRLRTLFAEVYDLPFAAIHDVADVQVLQTECQHPVFPARLLTGSWTQTLPDHRRTDVRYEGSEAAGPVWIDLDAELSVTLVLVVDPGEVESFRIAPLEEFGTLEDFRDRFRPFDLDAFMAEHGLRTAEDLRRAFRHLLGEVRLRPLPAFDPDDPAHRRRFPLRLAVLIRDTVDTTAALRDVRTLLHTAEHALAYRRQGPAHAEARAPLAPLLVFSSAGLPPGGPSREQLSAFFARQNVLAVFQDP
ncbi:hypothetical protein [Streptomyces sp. NPDC056468]|uniref:hypothetical protein n=1 Tax=Streptomyces sp. NPDC056468 TaxID=3345830 RepID=UPI003697EE1D